MSLLEVVVGMTIIGIAITSGLVTSSAELRGATQAVALSEINALAELKLNEGILRLEQIGIPANGAETFEHFRKPMDDYEWRVKVQVHSPENLALVSVTVRSRTAERTLHAVVPWTSAGVP